MVFYIPIKNDCLLDYVLIYVNELNCADCESKIFLNQICFGLVYRV
jgi:hypothetical protein